MFEENLNQAEELVIVWIPFVVKRQSIQSASMNPPLLQQPNHIRQIPHESTNPHPQQTNGAATKGHGVRRGLASIGQKDCILKLSGSQNIPIDQICQKYGVDTLDQLSNEQAHDFISAHKDQPQF